MDVQVAMAQALQWIQGGAIVLVLTAERMLPALGLDQDPSFYQVRVLLNIERIKPLNI